MQPQSIIITGASGGLGAALARVYAGPNVTLGLLGRNAARLAAVAADVQKLGARCFTATIDVTDTPAMDEWIRGFARDHGLDLCVANAGLSGGTYDGGESATQAAAIFNVNLNGVLNTVHPAIEVMKRHGQIAIIGSIAGYRGVASAPAYTASKAAVRYYGQALRALLAPRGIGVTVICPGFIRTPMTAVNQFPMPFIMEPDNAARIIRRRLPKNPAILAFPRIMMYMARLQNWLPDFVVNKIYDRLPAKTNTPL